MIVINIDDFNRELDCTYNAEKYSVRDNGAVMRYPREGKPPRPSDNKWTFGKPNLKTGYMDIVSDRVHRIVATAFHGNPPTPEHVVDHVDTNRRNNRPENLRWLTRLENALCNPVTVRKIELICGSLEAFLADPSKLYNSGIEPNLEWMRTVNSEEAQACLRRMHLWATSGKTPSGGRLDEWVYSSIEQQPSTPTIEVVESELVISKTPGAAQREWRTPTEFPCCPPLETADPISTYAENLKRGVVFSKNDYGNSKVEEIAISSDNECLWVVCNNKHSIKNWSLTKVTFEENLFIHTSKRTFFQKDGARKALHLEQGLEWNGEDTIDDYC